jgi:hypothetical protein
MSKKLTKKQIEVKEHIDQIINGFLQGMSDAQAMKVLSKLNYSPGKSKEIIRIAKNKMIQLDTPESVDKQITLNMLSEIYQALKKDDTLGLDKKTKLQLEVIEKMNKVKGIANNQPKLIKNTMNFNNMSQEEINARLEQLRRIGRHT